MPGGARTDVSGHGPVAAPTPGRALESVWICLYFNKIEIEVHKFSNDCAGALVTDSRHAPRILQCNEPAFARGVRFGMSVSAALALAPDLTMAVRDAALERRALEGLATWAMRYTPAISIVAGNALLLDVRASLMLFGGLPALRRLIVADLAGRHYRVTLSSAPTPVAALWLARAGRADPADPAADDLHPGNNAPPAGSLAGRLATLPIACFGWPERVRRTLAQMGVETFGDCVRLPRDGFARRVGAACRQELDRALGLQPEPRAWYRPARHFTATLDLPAETADAGLLVAATRRLLCKLDAFLVTHQVAVQTLWIRLFHLGHPASLLRIGLLSPVTDARYWHELIRLRFFHHEFTAPVHALTVEAHATDAVMPDGADLFGTRPDRGRQELGLLEQLCVRLGDEAVHGICPVPEHRPEAAWRPVRPADRLVRRHRDATGCGESGMSRPLWMLREPQALRIVAGRPVFRDALEFEAGPERIESGWWDGRDIRRDYYVARNGRGARFWVFEDRRAAGWYLHGLFG